MSDFASVKAGIEENMADFKKRIDEALGTDITVEVDFDSYENADCADRVWYRAGYTGWDGYYIMREAAYGIERCANDYDGADTLKDGISTVKFVQENGGCPREEACRMEGDTLVIGGSHCCWSHQFNDYSLKKYLARHFDLVIKYYIKQITEVGIPEAYEEMDSHWDGEHIEIEFDEASFDYDMIEDEEQRKIMREEALENAAYYRAYYPIRTLADRLTDFTRGGYDDITKEEIFNCVEKIVVHNMPNMGDDYYVYNLKNAKYDMRTKVLHLNSVYENYWGRLSYWEPADKVREVIKIYRMGEFHDMSVELHEEKLKLLESVCNSWDVYYNRFDYLKDMIQYPCFYPKSNHEQQCFVKLMEHINTEKYRKANIPEDVLEAEEINLSKKGVDPETYSETFIAGWAVEKVNWKGMKQDRLLWVTDRAMYTAKPNYKSKKPENVHRYAHEHYTRVYAGELKFKTVGGISASGLPGVPGMPDMPDMPDVPDVPDVDLPDAPNVDLPGDLPDIKGLSLKDFKGPPWAVRAESDRPRSDEKKIPSFKLPDIPNLKDIVCNALRKMVDAIKSVEFPEFNPPGLPEFKLPNLIEIMGKAKPKMPDGSVPEYDPNTPNYSCGPGTPNDPEGMDKFTELNQKVNEMDDPPVIKKLPGMPDNLLTDLLGKITDMVESVTSFEIDLPKEFTLDGILKMIGKKLAKMADATGISMPSLPDLDFGAALEMVKEVAADTPLAGEIGTLCSEVGKGASEMSPVKWPDFPKLDPSMLLDEIVAQLDKVELPEMPSLDLPDLPGLPGLPGDLPGLPGGPDMPSISVSGPKKSDTMQGVFHPVMPDGVNEGVSKYVTQEIAWVIYAGARAYKRPYGACSPWVNYTIEAETTSVSGIYNKLGRGKVKAPTSEGTPVEEGEL